MRDYKVCWLSAGVSSFVAGVLANDVDEWIYIDIANQHPDTLRFIHDIEKFIKKEVTILKSADFNSVEDVIKKYKFINSPYGAPCTGMLKKAVRKKWENQHLDYNLTYVWGMDADEKKRADGIMKNFPEFKHEFPLIEKKLTKQDCHAMVKKWGIKRPMMYELGYNNNNCIGCVKGGMGYWNKIRKDFPEVFISRAKLEREIGHSCIKGIFLDELSPDRGRMTNEIMEECGIMCYGVLEDMEKE